MLLDKIADGTRGLCGLIEAAFTHNKYNLACNLLRMLTKLKPASNSLQPYDLLHHFAEHCLPGTEKIMQVRFFALFFHSFARINCLVYYLYCLYGGKIK